MLRKSFAAVFASIFVSGAAFAAPPPAAPPTYGGAGTGVQATQLSDTFSVLHAVSLWAMRLSEMADTRAKSDLVKNYARSMANANAGADARLLGVAQANGIPVVPLNPQSEEGRSLILRMNGEAALLGSLQGDAFDKEYMTLVTNTQQSVLHVLETSRMMATTPQVRQFIDELANTVQNRLNAAQAIMVNVYGNRI